jgi:hypothetical protein
MLNRLRSSGQARLRDGLLGQRVHGVVQPFCPVSSALKIFVASVAPAAIGPSNDTVAAVASAIDDLPTEPMLAASAAARNNGGAAVLQKAPEQPPRRMRSCVCRVAGEVRAEEPAYYRRGRNLPARVSARAAGDGD